VERKEAYPAGGVNRILMRMIAPMSNLIRHIVNRDYPVKKRDEDEN
jgi:hypothetical protein